MNNLKDELFVTAGIKTPVGHVDEARRLWRAGHRIIQAAVEGPVDRTADGKASADLYWVKNELRKQLRQVEHLVPGMNAGSLELFRLCDDGRGSRVVIDSSAGIAWTLSQYQDGPTKLRADMDDWSDQVIEWFEGIRNQIVVSTSPKPKKPTADDLMKAELAANFEVSGFTAQQWADRIGRSKSTVVETETWKSLSQLRSQMKMEKVSDRHRR